MKDLNDFEKEEYDALESVDKAIVELYWEDIDDSLSPQEVLDKLVWIGSIESFIDDSLDNLGIDIPDWVYIDYDKTWNNNLSYDYDAIDNYIFSKY